MTATVVVSGSAFADGYMPEGQINSFSSIAIPGLPVHFAAGTDVKLSLSQ